ncbi:MAG: FecR domain-containing protein [Alphaproteobacteria bacterium]|nr:FecR domain-containing protein [Alphaproteobacteria bacterium]
MRWAAPVVVVVLILAALAALVRYTAADGGPGPLVVEEVQGDVRRVREGDEIHAQLGMHLRPGDRVSTGPGGRATLTRGGSSSLRLSEGTSVELSGIDDGVIELQLQRGRLRARVRPDGGALRVANAERSVLATSATFDAAVDADGVLTVEAQEGELAVSGLTDVARLQPGQRLVAFADGSSAVEPIPTQLLLEVPWPDPSPAELVTVVGRTAAGVEVRLKTSRGEVQGRADARGGFSLEVPLEPGDNQVELIVTDALDRQHRQVGTLVRTPGRAPNIRDIHVDYGAR